MNPLSRFSRDRKRAGTGEQGGENRLRAIVLTLAALSVGPLLLFLFYRHGFAGLVNPDAMDYAQLGRNLGAGRGFSTSILRPLALTHGADPLHQPDVTHGPLYPFVLALAFGALGAKESVAAGVSGLFYLLTLPLIYLLGARVFSRTVGVIAALGFAVNTLTLQMAISGTPMTLYMFVMTALLLVLYGLASRVAQKPEERSPRGLLVGAGLLSGALYLADPVFVFALPALIGIVPVVCRRDRFAATAVFCAALSAVALPWMVRNAVLTGNPVFGLKGLEVWMGTSQYPGYSAYRLTPDQIVPGTGLFHAVVRKALDNFLVALPGLVGGIAGPLLVFLVPSLLFRFANPAVNHLRAVMLFAVLGLFVGQLLFGVNLTMFAVLVPAFLLFSVAFLLHLGKQARMERGALLGASALAVVVVLCPIARELMRPVDKARLPHAATAASLARLSKAGDVCLSDQPWLVAWHADRPALWIPSMDAQTQEMRRRFKAHWMLLTSDAGALSPGWGQTYQVFAQWDMAYRQSQQGLSAPPPAFEIPAAGKDAPALVRALQGFGPVPPDGGADGSITPPPAVLAAAVSQIAAARQAEVTRVARAQTSAGASRP